MSWTWMRTRWCADFLLRSSGSGEKRDASTPRHPGTSCAGGRMCRSGGTSPSASTARASSRAFFMQLATAVWSIPPELLWTMLASTLIAFFMAHDAEGLGRTERRLGDGLGRQHQLVLQP